MSKAAIYVVNNSAQSVDIDGAINPGSIIRRFGPGLGIAGNAIQMEGSGYYSLNTSITLSGVAAGDVTVTVFKNGVAIPGATASETITAAGDIANLSIDALIREVNCCYNSGPVNLTFIVTGAAVTVTNIASVIIKL